MIQGCLYHRRDINHVDLAAQDLPRSVVRTIGGGIQVVSKAYLSILLSLFWPLLSLKSPPSPFLDGQIVIVGCTGEEEGEGGGPLDSKVPMLTAVTKEKGQKRPNEALPMACLSNVEHDTDRAVLSLGRYYTSTGLHSPPIPESLTQCLF